MNGTKEMTLVPAPEQPDEMLPMIERLAAMKDFDVAKLSALLDMRERVMDRQNEAAFNAAFAEMQAHIPTVPARAKTNMGKYAPREDIVDAVRPVLQAHGFSLSFRTEWPDKNTVLVVGILTHRDGHARESQFQTAADQTGSKNAVQALGSAVEYGRRYTTTDLLNIATRNADDDATTATQRPEPPKGFTEWWEGMGDVVPEGMARYAALWKDAKAEYRNYVNDHLRAVHDTRKAAAEIADKKRVQS